ncbi:MAG: alcohol dehydrogenase [Nitrososphaeraceae archaeon]
MKAARIIEPKKPLKLDEIELPRPEGSEVLVRVKASGLCHSDIHLWEGGYQGPGNTFIKSTDRGVKYPLIPGHEIAGTVEETGNKIADSVFYKDDKVIVYPWIGEGLCPACVEGKENLCDDPKSLGIYRDGGFAEYVLVPDLRYLIKINEKGKGKKIDMDFASILPCSALTAYSAVKNANLRPYDNIVIVGSGGLGLNAIQIAKSLYGVNTIAMDRNNQKLKIAERNGADETINPNEEDPVKKIKDLTYGKGAGVVIDFVNSSKSVDTDLEILRKRGKLLLVGLFGGEVKINLLSMPTKAYELRGSYTGTREELVELIALAQKGIIRSIVSEKFKLDRSNEALTKLREGKIEGRGVLNP